MENPENNSGRESDPPRITADQLRQIGKEALDKRETEIVAATSRLKVRLIEKIPGFEESMRNRAENYVNIEILLRDEEYKAESVAFSGDIIEKIFKELFPDFEIYVWRRSDTNGFWVRITWWPEDKK